MFKELFSWKRVKTVVLRWFFACQKMIKAHSLRLKVYICPKIVDITQKSYIVNTMSCQVYNTTFNLPKSEELYIIECIPHLYSTSSAGVLETCKYIILKIFQ